VSFGCGILLADVLNRFEFFGFKLGFWFAQQGSIYPRLSISPLRDWE
jgi:putative solute:sodium symporter small subunit